MLLNQGVHDEEVVQTLSPNHDTPSTKLHGGMMFSCIVFLLKSSTFVSVIPQNISSAEGSHGAVWKTSAVFLLDISNFLQALPACSITDVW